ncbi:MAG TPA: MFS transporter [Bryobacteraceae bacterium]|nr:MFS transporter [Bryobacteraceae bacterium]
MRSYPSSFSLRWFAVCIFVVSSTLNYLDRNLLALLAPLVMTDLHFNQTHYGLLISAFSIAYAASSLLCGWFLDRFGINRTISGAVGWWSLAAIGHGIVNSFPGLGMARAALGIGESAGVPAVGKLNGIYLKPEERALGAAVNQVGLSLAGIIGPLWVAFAIRHSWREPFVINGLLGLLWIPLWLVVNRAIPARYAEQELALAKTRVSKFSILADRNLLLLIAANLLWMSGYSLWSNWTTLYLVHVSHIPLAATPRYVWIPPLVSNLGGFFGGWLSLRWMRKRFGAIAARRRAVLLASICSLFALLLPLAPDAAWATAGISISYFFSLAGSVNIYALPIDLYGAERSGLAIAALTASFGVLQMVISPLIGTMGDHNLYSQVIWLATLPLLASALVLFGLKETRSESQ